MLRNGTTAEAAPAAETPAAQESQADQRANGQVETPSESTPTSESSPDQRTGNDWFRQAFNAQRYGGMVTRQPEAPAGGDDSSESGSSSGAPESVPSSAEGRTGQPAASAPASTEQASPSQSERDTLALTQEELERRVQAETDRRLDKYQREEAERRKREEKRRLRETDPYAYAALEKEEEAKSEALQRELANAHRMTLSTVETYDKSVLDPLMRAVPDADRQAILSSIQPGLPGRGQAATQALKVLENHWKQQGVAQARETLMKDQSFVKEVLAKYGGMRQEPDNIPAAAAPQGRSFNVNDSLRMAARGVRR